MSIELPASRLAADAFEENAIPDLLNLSLASLGDKAGVFVTTDRPIVDIVPAIPIESCRAIVPVIIPRRCFSF